MKPRQWITISLLLIIVGVTFLIVVNITYAPRIVAYREALNAWVEGNTGTEPPTLEWYGLDTTSFYLFAALGAMGTLLVFIGAAYLVIYVIARLTQELRLRKIASIIRTTCSDNQFGLNLSRERDVPYSERLRNNGLSERFADFLINRSLLNFL